MTDLIDNLSKLGLKLDLTSLQKNILPIEDMIQGTELDFCAEKFKKILKIPYQSCF